MFLAFTCRTLNSRRRAAGVSAMCVTSCRIPDLPAAIGPGVNLLVFVGHIREPDLIDRPGSLQVHTEVPGVREQHRRDVRRRVIELPHRSRHLLVVLLAGDPEDLPAFEGRVLLDRVVNGVQGP